MSKTSDLNTTIEDWRTEVESYNKDSEGATIKELMEAFGLSRHAVMNIVNDAIAAHRCTIGTAWRTYKNGRVVRVPVYKIEPNG